MHPFDSSHCEPIDESLSSSHGRCGWCSETTNSIIHCQHTIDFYPSFWSIYVYCPLSGVSPSPGVIADWIRPSRHSKSMNICMFQMKQSVRVMESHSLSIQMACKTFSHLVNRNGINFIPPTPPQAEFCSTNAWHIQSLSYTDKTVIALDDMEITARGMVSISSQARRFSYSLRN